jgi:type IV secretion system protein VirD4
MMNQSKVYAGQIVSVIAVTIGTLWGATQWTASQLGYQSALGAPWTVVGNTPVYRPWALFDWWYHFEPYAPTIFNRGGTIAASGGGAAILVAVGLSLWRSRHSKFVTTYGSARWAKLPDVRHAGLLGSAGIILGMFAGRYLRHNGPEHVLAFAPTRSGKGVGLVVPTLLSWTGSAVIHDIKGENWALTAGFRSRFSHTLLFNPTDLRSARYNPLLEVRKGAHEVRDAQNIADILVDPEGALERRNHWEKTAHSLLVGIILHVLYAESDKSLARVAHILSDPARAFDKTLEDMMATNHLGTEDAPQVHPVVAEVARELLNKSPNEGSSVLSTAMGFVALYRDPTIAHVTSACDWRIADLDSAPRPVSLYLVVPPSDISRTKPLVRLLLNQIGRRLTESDVVIPKVDAGPWRLFKRKNAVTDKSVARHKLLLMLDEFPALGRLDFFESALAYLAGYGIRAFLIAQSLNQIEKAYGQNNAVLDNCHVRVAFATNDERTAKRISDSLGTTTQQRAVRNFAGNRLAVWLGHTMESQQETPRALLTPGEVMQLPQDQAIVMVSGAPPIRATKLKYYRDRNFTARCLPAPTLSTGRYADRPAAQGDDWAGCSATVHPQLVRPRVDGVALSSPEEVCGESGAPHSSLTDPQNGPDSKTTRRNQGHHAPQAEDGNPGAARLAGKAHNQDSAQRGFGFADNRHAQGRDTSGDIIPGRGL